MIKIQFWESQSLKKKKNILSFNCDYKMLNEYKFKMKFKNIL